MDPDFFETLYVHAAGDETAVPWQDAHARELVREWLASVDPARHHRALVVAAGLGDDAVALADIGVDVVAFDVAPTAVEWARRRHPDAAVEWHVADLFALPDDWHGAFDLVLEVSTVQSIPPDLQPDAVRAVRALVAPGGTLLVVALTTDDPEPPPGPPWLLVPSVVYEIVDGCEVRARQEDDLAPSVRVLRMELANPS
jgi:ubiquinone/menaquinone biosynthesis C-methylase UbiE